MAAPQPVGKALVLFASLPFDAFACIIPASATFCILFHSARIGKFIHGGFTLSRPLKPVISAIVVIALLISVVSCMVLYGQNKKLKDTLLRAVDSQWRQLYGMSDNVDRHIISGSLDASEFQLYVNQTCYYPYTFGGEPELSALSATLHNWLALYYDQIFMHVATETNEQNREKAFALLKDMNAELMELCKSVITMDANARASLLDETSKPYMELYQKVASAEKLYQEKAEEYFSARELP